MQDHHMLLQSIEISKVVFGNILTYCTVSVYFISNIPTISHHGKSADVSLKPLKPYFNSFSRFPTKTQILTRKLLVNLVKQEKLLQYALKYALLFDIIIIPRQICI